MRRLLNLALVIALAPLIYAFTYEGCVYLASVFTFQATMWFLAGAVVFLLVYLLLLNNSIGFIEHFLHESEHAAVSFLFTFRFPKRMEIDPVKGSKVVVPETGGCLMILAPYYLPLLTVPLLILRALADLVFSLLKTSTIVYLDIGFDLLIGATWALHLMCTVKEYGSFQTDIKKTGLIPSLVGVLFLNFVFVLLCVTVVVGSYAESLEYLKTAAAATVDAYRFAFGFLKTQLLPAGGKLMKSIGDRFCRTCTPTPAP